jgi:hypothetical protein
LHGFERTHGSREVARVDDVPIPDLATGEVLIRVLRAGLNYGDLHMREDAVQYSPEVKTVPDLPMTIGTTRDRRSRPGCREPFLPHLFASDNVRLQ